MVTVEFDSMGEAVRLALVADEYVGGGLAVLLLDATDPRSEGYMAGWGVLTANVPSAAEWCRGHGNIAIDAAVPRRSSRRSRPPACSAWPSARRRPGWPATRWPRSPGTPSTAWAA